MKREVSTINKIFTIGFTKKKAQIFFELLKKNNVKTLIDIRLHNTSQLAGFAKYPDIEFFLKEICNINYIHDKKFAPKEITLSNYKKKIISWEKYEEDFFQTMSERKVNNYIKEKFPEFDNICLLCSEDTPNCCHRRLVADLFKLQFQDVEIIHL